MTKRWKHIRISKELRSQSFNVGDDFRIDTGQAGAFEIHSPILAPIPMLSNTTVYARRLSLSKPGG
jgi:hypothetical protein